MAGWQAAQASPPAAPAGPCAAAAAAAACRVPARPPLGPLAPCPVRAHALPLHFQTYVCVVIHPLQDIFDAKTAVDHLSGFNVQVRISEQYFVFFIVCVNRDALAACCR